VLSEIEEFYSYLEIPQLAENMKAFEGSFKHGTFQLTTLNSSFGRLILLIQEIGRNRPCSKDASTSNFSWKAWNIEILKLDL
jgi:hypothetical protein